MTKIVRTINIDKEIWETLPNYINTSRSAFFEEQAIKKINQLDDIEKIELEIQSIKNKVNDLEIQKQNLKARKEEILKQRKTNEKDAELKEKCMNIIRTVVKNEGAISEQRVKFIAKNNSFKPEFLLELVMNENLKIISE